MLLPVILRSGESISIELAHWGHTPPKMHSPIQAYPIDKTPVRPPFNRWIRLNRCLVPANCFFMREKQSDRVHLIRLLDKRLFMIGGICLTPDDQDRDDATHFFLLTTDSADILQPLGHFMPVIIPPDEAKQWLEADHLMDLMQMADRSGDYWFDYFPVSSKVLAPGSNSRNLLRPEGLSVREIAARDQKLKAVDLKQERYDRKGSKR